MKNFFKIISDFFYPEKLLDDQVEKVFFYYDIANTNISRLIIFNYVLSIGLIGILTFDATRYLNNTLDVYAKELAITHIVFLFYCAITIISSKLIARRIQNQLIFRFFFLLIAFFLFLILIWTTLIDQKANGQITVIIMGYFGVSVLLYLFPIDSLILYIIVSVILFYFLPQYQTNPQVLTSHYINIPILILISYFISVIFFKSKLNDFIKSKKIEQTTSELDELIQKILPIHVAYKLRKENRFEPFINENVTIVFIDFVSFSTIMEKTNVNIVFSVLDELFNKFYKVIKKYNLEKIKTIGDSYMFAGGLFSEYSQAKECVDACLEIIDLLNNEQSHLLEKTGHNWYIRAGIDKGKVISGVIGDWRFVFDIWGNSVNIASRLQSISLPQKISISRNVFEEIRLYNEYHFEPRGKLPIKNLQPIEIFFVERTKKMLSNDWTKK